MYRTVISGSIKATEFLLKHNADPNIRNNLGETSLHQAADNSQYELAELLLKNNANPNVQQNDGDTPLHHAAYRGDLKMVEMLMKYKADPNIRNYMFGRSPLHYAADNDYIDTLQVLVNYNGDSYLKDKHGKTPLDLINDKTLAKTLKKPDQIITEDVKSIQNSDIVIEPEGEACHMKTIEEKPLYV